MILIAEDNDLMCKVLADALDEYEIDTAEDGHQLALKAIVTPYDLIIVDINLPKLDGATAVRQIRDNKGPNQKTKIFALTGDFDPTLIMSSGGAGFDEILIKPVGIADLLYRVAHALSLA